jgi:diguanylate cyclase (GGDEF)-like protein/putative nucleotidyltransferase with HDIG domain
MPYRRSIEVYVVNSHALIPLIATVAYIPLLVIVLMSRPWQPRQRLFFLFLVPAMLWSATDIFFRSTIFNEQQQKLIMVKIVLFWAVWMIIQYRYFVQSFYKSDVAKRPFAYISLAVFTGLLMAPNLIPYGQPGMENGITFSWLDGVIVNMHVNYGPFLYVLAAVFLVIYARDMHNLIRKLKVSGNVEERNQIIYLFVGLACLAIFGLITFRFSAEGTPVGHIGNFLNACILTYAVVTFRLLDIRVVLRRAVFNLALYGTGIGIVLLLLWLTYRYTGFELNMLSFLIAIGGGISVVLYLAHKLGVPWRMKIEKIFIGERYDYRKQLTQFINTMQSVSNMEQFGNDFIHFVAQSMGCSRACLLLPQAEDGTYVPRFTYPPVENNPTSVLELKADDPIVFWLKRERTLLPENRINIHPEFKSIWQEEIDNIQLAGVQVFVPLIHMDQLVGILAISERRDGKPYTVEDFDLLNSIGVQVAAGMEKEYMYEQLREQDREITFINRLSAIVTSSVNIETIFEGFVQELRKIVQFDWITITSIDEGEICVLALSSIARSPWQPEQRIPLEGTATEWVCRERKSLYEADIAQNQIFYTGKEYLRRGIHSVVYLPLTIKDQSIGSLIVASHYHNAFTPKQIRLLEQVALQIATPIENSRLYEQAEQRARIDELTGLYNRRHFEERLKEEVSRHSRHGDIFSVFLLDLDNFKAYNDRYGHPSGDMLLNRAGKIISNSIRDADRAFRYGGDEFVVILPLTTTDDARVVADRVRQRIADEMEKGESPVTCSIGLASYPSDGVVSIELVTVADTALYFAKSTGGNRVYLSSKILTEPQDNAGTYARRNGLSTIYALVSTVEAKDPYTYGHSRKVNKYAVALAEAIGLSPEEVSRVSTAALLHDIGKIGVPDKILNKKRKLSREDWEAIKTHPKLGATIVGNVPNLVPCVSSILHHHERWDGTGYPEGLKGEEISIEARILTIADSFEAMSSARPYRPALCSEKIFQELRQGAGSQFDPELVEIFINLINSGFPERQELATIYAGSRQAQSQV